MSQKRELNYVKLHGDLFIPDVGNLKATLTVDPLVLGTKHLRMYLLENGDVECWARNKDGIDVEFIISGANCTVKMLKPTPKVVPLKK